MKRQSPEPKFRAECTWCGARNPRPATAWTVARWLEEHVKACEVREREALFEVAP